MRSRWSVEGVRYEYRVDLDDSAVVFEGLYSYPERRRRVLFEREGMELRLRRGLGALSGTRELLTPTTLALSAAMRLDEREVGAFGRSVSGIGVLGLRRRAPGRSLGGRGIGSSTTGRLFEERGSLAQSSLFDEPGFERFDDRESALALLRFADLGIDDVQIVEDPDDDGVGTSSNARREPRRQLRLMHRVAEQELPFELEEESAGNPNLVCTHRSDAARPTKRADPPV